MTENEAANPQGAAIPESTERRGTIDASQAVQIIEQVREHKSQPETPDGTEDAEQTNPEDEPRAKEDESQPEEQDEGESEANEDTPEDADTEPEGHGEELSDFTVDDLAEALDLESAGLADKLRVSVKINGETREVTLSEALKGYQLEADYRQKTAEIAEKARGLEQREQSAVDQLRAKHQAADDLMSVLVQSLKAGPTDEQLSYLRENDPTEYLRVRDERERAVSVLNRAYAERQKARDTEAREKEAAQREWREKQTRALLSMPDFNTPDKVVKFETEAREVLKEHYAFGDKEVDNFFSHYDARQVGIVRDAIKYRQMMRGAKTLKEKVRSKPKFAKPGPSKAVSGKKSDAVGALRKRLQSASPGREQKAAAVELIKAKRG